MLNNFLFIFIENNISILQIIHSFFVIYLLKARLEMEIEINRIFKSKYIHATVRFKIFENQTRTIKKNFFTNLNDLRNTLYKEIFYTYTYFFIFFVCALIYFLHYDLINYINCWSQIVYKFLTISFICVINFNI